MKRLAATFAHPPLQNILATWLPPLQNWRVPLLALKAVFAASVALACTSVQAADQVTLPTTSGPVVGQVDSGNIMGFKGIPYGADTTGKRFEPPRKPAPWKTPLKALAYGPDCPQRGSKNMSENCLFLNVWAPMSGEARKPVMVYIHGGAYAHGSGSDDLYNGTRLAAKGDMVVVTLNHRLGPLGYTYFGQLDAPQAWQFSGNVGQLDLILALKWVRENIDAFGGNPANITVVGQSGGGGKIATLMAMPEAKGLFHKAMTMSGQQVTASGPLNATKRTRAYLKGLGVTETEVSMLRTMPLAALLAATRETDPVLGYGSLYFGPVLDMKSLKRHPFYPGAPEQSAHIPMVIGNTLDETRLFLSNTPAHHSLTWETLPKYLTPNMRVDIDPYHVRDAYRQMFPDLSPSEIFFKATTAARSWRAAIIEAEERAKQKAPTWVYQLNWQSPKDGGKWRAPHTLDIPFIFMTTDVPHALSGNSEGAQKMAELMSDIVISLARTGSPQAASLPAWPQFNLEKRPTLLLDTPPTVADDPRGNERKLFEAVPYIQPGS